MERYDTKPKDTEPVIWEWGDFDFEERVRREMLLPAWDRPSLYKDTLKELMV